MKKLRISKQTNLIIGLVIVFILSAQSLMAAKWTDSGNYSISWYDKNAKDLYISTEKDLAGIAYLVNNGYTTFAGQTIHLKASLDMGEYDWTPIGANNKVFQGVFDGESYFISQIRLNENGEDYLGIWRELKNATVKNLKISVREINSYIGCIGALVGKAENTDFANIYVNDYCFNYNRGKLSNQKQIYVYIGGITGYSVSCKYDLIRVYNEIDFQFGSSNGDNIFEGLTVYAGGIAGYCEGKNNYFVRCWATNEAKFNMYGYITDNPNINAGGSTVNFGGILGYSAGSLWSNAYLTSCYGVINKFYGYDNNGTFRGVTFNTGGIVGTADASTTLNNCVGRIMNYTVRGHDYTWPASWYKTDSSLGGIIGISRDAVINGCYSNSNVNKIIEKVRNDQTGENGNASINSYQMDTQSFVDELNIYCFLNDLSNRWTLNDSALALIMDFLYYSPKEDQEIIWNQDLSNLTVGDEVIFTATASSGLNVTYEVIEGSDKVTLSGNKLTCNSSGNVTVKATQAGNGAYNSASKSRSFTIKKKSQTITWDQDLSNLTVGDEITLTATASSGLNITYEVTQGSANVTLSGNKLTCNSSGNVTIKSTQAGNYAYNSISRLRSFTITKKPQTITWDQDLSNLTVGDEVTLTATASSGLDVRYSIIDGTDVAEVNGNKLLCKTVGSFSIKAVQYGDDTYKAASPVTKNLSVVENNQTVNPTVIVDGIVYILDRETRTAKVGDNRNYDGTDVEILSKVNFEGVSYTVNEISESSFNFAHIEHITLPATISKIDTMAFSWCYRLTDINLPNNLEYIGMGAFEDCLAIKNVDIPQNVNFIGEGAFRDCENLSEINVDSRNKCYTSIDGVLFDKNLSVLFQYPAGKVDLNYDVPTTVIELAGSSFMGSNLKSIKIPRITEIIGDEAFSFCVSLKDVYISSGIKQIGKEAFWFCNGLQNFTIEVFDPYDVSILEDTFYKVDFEDAVLYVPNGAVNLYEQASVWKDFGTITTIPSSSPYYLWGDFSSYGFKGAYNLCNTTQDGVYELSDVYLDKGFLWVWRGDWSECYGVPEDQNVKLDKDMYFVKDGKGVGIPEPIFARQVIFNKNNMTLRINTSSGISDMMIGNQYEIIGSTVKVADGLKANVYSIDGRLIDANISEVTLTSGFYLLRIGDQTHKIHIQ